MITSTSNPQIKQVVNLQAKGKVRSELGLFVVEGRKMVEEVPESLCRKVFVSESYLESQKNRNFFDKFQVETVPAYVRYKDAAGDSCSSAAAEIYAGRSYDRRAGSGARRHPGSR